MAMEDEDKKKKEGDPQGSDNGDTGGNAPPPAAGGDNAPPPPSGGDQPQTSEEAPSVQVAKAVYTSLKNLQSNLAAAANTYENPRAKEYFDGPFTQKCNETMGEIKGLIGELGGNTEDAPSGGEATDPNEDEEAMKSFLALGNTNDLKLLGYVAPLNALSRAKNLTEEQRLAIGGVLKSIKGLCNDARSNAEEAKKKALAAQVSSLQETQNGLNQGIETLQKTLNQLLGKR